MLMNRAVAIAVGCVIAINAFADTQTPTSHPSTRPSTHPTSRPGGEIVAPLRRDVPGRRVELSCGELFVPAYLGEADRVDLVLWFRGAAWCVEQEFSDAHLNAVLFTWNESKQKLGFTDQASADKLLAEIQAALEKPKIDHLALGSFSGGYPAVLDLLKLEAVRDRVTDVVLADSLYPPRGATTFAQLDGPLAPFLAFAKQAAKGEGTFVFSQLYPPEAQYRGNGTTITAMWLIDRTGAMKAECDDIIDGRRRLYHADLGGLHVIGFAGMMNQDHFDHLYHLDTLLKQTSMCAKP